jgi:RNA polymerase sigma-70 factor (ECF subfamily)
MNRMYKTCGYWALLLAGICLWMSGPAWAGSALLTTADIESTMAIRERADALRLDALQQASHMLYSETTIGRDRSKSLIPLKFMSSISAGGTMATTAEQVLQFLEASDHGDELALENLIGVVYNELRALAAVQLKQERPDHTLQPTALVHEVYLRLFEQRSVKWHNRLHFFRVATHQIRRVLVDHARHRNRDKRYGNLCRVTLDQAVDANWPIVDMLSLDDALKKLESHSADAHRSLAPNLCPQA